MSLFRLQLLLTLLAYVTTRDETIRSSHDTIRIGTKGGDIIIYDMIRVMFVKIQTFTIFTIFYLWSPWWLMLRSQIKLTSYDFSDLHITGEFDNRPGTGRFLRIFFCVVTYRTGAGRRLYMKTSADAWPGTVRRRTVPGRRCKRSTGHRTVPGRFYTNFHVQWWIYVHLYIKIRHYTSKETVC